MRKLMFFGFIVVVCIAGVGVGSELQLRAVSKVDYDKINVLARYFTGFVTPDFGLYNGGKSGVGSEGWLSRYGTGKELKVVDIHGGDYSITFERKWLFFVDKNKPIVVVKVVPALICPKHSKAAWLESDAVEGRYKLSTSLLLLKNKLAKGEDSLENLVAFQIRDSWKKDFYVRKLRKEILDHFEKTIRKYNHSDLSHPIAEVCK